MKNPRTPAVIEPATFRFVAQHLNHCATAVLLSNMYQHYNQTACSVHRLKYKSWSESKLTIYLCSLRPSLVRINYVYTVLLSDHYTKTRRNSKLFFHFLLISVSVQCYQPSRHHCFHPLRLEIFGP